MNVNGRSTAGSLRTARKELGLSQEALARLADCSKDYVRLLESGYCPEKSAVLDRLLIALQNSDDPADNGADAKTDGGVVGNALAA